MTLPMTMLALSPLLLAGLWLVRRDRRDQAAYRRLSFMAVKTDNPGAWLLAAHRRLLTPPENRAGLAALALSMAAGLALGLPTWMVPLAAPAVGLLARLAVKRRRLNLMRARFNDRFPEAVATLTRAVQAGVPVERALGSLSELFEGELSERFKLLTLHLELGVPFREALTVFSSELESPDVDFFCSILALNREIGSRLSPMLLSLERTLRDRKTVDRKLRALTAESRSAARILSALPFFVLGLEALLNPRQLSFLFSDPTGRTVLVVCAICMWAGLVTIGRMSRLMERS
jgi:tight adherence protein B